MDQHTGEPDDRFDAFAPGGSAVPLPPGAPPGAPGVPGRTAPGAVAGAATPGDAPPGPAAGPAGPARRPGEALPPAGHGSRPAHAPGGAGPVAAPGPYPGPRPAGPAAGGRRGGSPAYDRFDGFDGFDGFDAFGGGRANVPLSPIVPAGAADPVPPEAASLFDSTAPLPVVPVRAARDPLVPEPGTPGGDGRRGGRVVAGDYLLTLNPVDGTEVVRCPPAELPVPVRRARDERAARMTAARPTPPPGPPAPELPLLERDEERERLIRLLARGRSIRVTGPSGVGRSALLESVANACGDLAPEGVLRLSGYRRTPADLLQDLYALVYAGDAYRAGRAELARLLGDVGAVVVVDDLEFGGAALEEVLATAPECAFLMSATPEVPAPAPDSMVEEVFLPGLSRAACLELLQLVAGRPPAQDEAAWAADLWFESEGLPLRFVQAGALLRQRDALGRQPDQDWEDSVWANGSPDATAALPDLTGFDGPGPSGAPAVPQPPAPGHGPDPVTGPGPGPVAGPGPVIGSGPVRPSPPAGGVPVPLPSLAQSAAPAELLASRLGESAREALVFAVALDGECPHPSHLPALVGDSHGDAALGELTSLGLAVPVASHFRLAAGVVRQLTAALAADGELSEVQAHSAALHYAWWAGHPSVTPERVAAEAEAILAAMTACRDGGQPGAVVLLARTVAPVFAASLHWGAWERALRTGQEAARLSGEVAAEAYFHHELGVIALCSGNTDRARAELEASIALRAALADRQGTVVGRRTLALVNDAAGEPPTQPLPPVPALASAAVAPASAVTAPVPAAETTLVLPEPVPPAALITRRTSAPAHAQRSGRRAAPSSRRNLVAAATGVLLAGALGTIVTLGAGSHGSSDTPNQVKPIESVRQGAPQDTTVPAPGVVIAPPAATTTSAAASPSATAPGGPATAPVTAFTDAGLTAPPATFPVTPGTPSWAGGGTTGGTAGGGSGNGGNGGGGGGHSTTGGPGSSGGTSGAPTSGGSTTSGSGTGGSTASGGTSGPSTGGGTSSGTSDGGSTTGASGGTSTGTSSGTGSSGGTTGTTGSTTSGSTSGTSGGTDTTGGSTSGTTTGTSTAGGTGTTP
jgi:hypothetical protein